MKECEWETGIVRLALEGGLDADTRLHLEGCERCRQVVFTIEALAEQRAIAEGEAWERLPSAGVVFDRAAAAHAEAASSDDAVVDRVLRPVIWIDRIATAVGVIVTTFAAGFGVRIVSIEGLLDAIFTLPAPSLELGQVVVVLVIAAAVVATVAVVGLTGLGFDYGRG